VEPKSSYDYAVVPASASAQAVSAIDRFCEQDAQASSPPRPPGRIRQLLLKVAERVRRPAVHRPLLIAVGLAFALLAAFFVFRPIYLSTLAPPLPPDAVENLSPVPTVPFTGAEAGQGAAVAGADTQDRDGADGAEEAFTEAGRFCDSFPDQCDLAIEKFNTIAAAHPGTKWETDAQARISEIIAAREEVMTQMYESAARDAGTLVEWEDYPAAVRTYESFLSVFPQTKFKDVISTEMARIRRNAATKVAVLAQRADAYIEKSLPDLARTELERILELAVDKESVERAHARLEEARKVADSIAKEREATSRALAEQDRKSVV
jgi:hypothetical protein